MATSPHDLDSPARPYPTIRLLGSPQKRVFTPSATSLVCDIKKRRLLNGVEGIQPNIYQTPKAKTCIRRIEGERGKTVSPKRNGRIMVHFATPQIERGQDGENQGRKEPREATKRPKFKARPVPKSQYAPSFVLKSSEKSLTIPEDPPLQTPSKSFPCSTRPSTEDYSFSTPFRARQMPDFSLITLPPKADFTPTKPEPFPLLTEERGKEKEIAFQHKLTMEAQSQALASQFIASPLPVFPPPRPILPVRPLTVPCEFNFVRPTKRQLLPTFPPINAFRARPMPDFSVPFRPVLSGIHTNPMEVELHSDTQAQNRALFDERVKEEQRRENLRVDREEREKEKRRAEEVKALRRQMEFQARPLPSPSKFSIQRSCQLLTVPVGPFLHTAERAALRSHCNENVNPNLSENQSHASTVCSEASMTMCEEGEGMDAEVME